MLFSIVSWTGRLQGMLIDGRPCLSPPFSFHRRQAAAEAAEDDEEYDEGDDDDAQGDAGLRRRNHRKVAEAPLALTKAEGQGGV